MHHIENKFKNADNTKRFYAYGTQGHLIHFCEYKRMQPLWKRSWHCFLSWKGSLLLLGFPSISPLLPHSQFRHVQSTLPSSSITGNT